jgi:hypothetical protein
MCWTKCCLNPSRIKRFMPSPKPPDRLRDPPRRPICWVSDDHSACVTWPFSFLNNEGSKEWTWRAVRQVGVLRTLSKIVCILKIEFQLPAFVTQVSGNVRLGDFTFYINMYSASGLISLCFYQSTTLKMNYIPVCHRVIINLQAFLTSDNFQRVSMRSIK